MRLVQFLMLVVAALPAAAQIGVSPPLVTVDLDASPTTQTVRLFNYGSEAVDVGVSVHDWVLDEQNEIMHRAPTEQSMSSWFVINPVRFRVEAGRSQVVRFSARPRVRPAPGEHRSMIYFNQLQPTNGPPLEVTFRLGVAVYGTAGDVVRRGSIDHAAVNRGSLVYRVASEGTAHVRLLGDFTVRRADSAETALRRALPTTPVLPGTARSFHVPLPDDLETGNYVLTFEARLGELPVTRRIPFSIKEPARETETARR